MRPPCRPCARTPDRRGPVAASVFGVKTTFVPRLPQEAALLHGPHSKDGRVVCHRQGDGRGARHAADVNRHQIRPGRDAHFTGRRRHRNLRGRRQRRRRRRRQIALRLRVGERRSLALRLGGVGGCAGRSCAVGAVGTGRPCGGTVGTGMPCGGTAERARRAPGAGAASGSTGGGAMSGGGPVRPKF